MKIIIKDRKLCEKYCGCPDDCAQKYEGCNCNENN